MMTVIDIQVGGWGRCVGVGRYVVRYADTYAKIGSPSVPFLPLDPYIDLCFNIHRYICPYPHTYIHAYTYVHMHNRNAGSTNHRGRDGNAAKRISSRLIKQASDDTWMYDVPGLVGKQCAYPRRVDELTRVRFPGGDAFDYGPPRVPSIYEFVANRTHKNTKTVYFNVILRYMRCQGLLVILTIITIIQETLPRGSSFQWGVHCFLQVPIAGALFPLGSHCVYILFLYSPVDLSSHLASHGLSNIPFGF